MEGMKMENQKCMLGYAISLLPDIPTKFRNLQMPGDGRYQPEELKLYLGYDMWTRWLVIVEYFWMLTLAEIGEMPEKDAKFLTKELLAKLLMNINTTKQDIIEKKTKHDMLALLVLMRRYLPKELHRWLHFCATSYDIINTAYALQLKTVFFHVFAPKLKYLDAIWRKTIYESVRVLQAGRTHLQTALPITFGFWGSNLHNRFIGSSRKAFDLANEIQGKFTGAVGTSASQRVLLKSKEGEKVLMEMLGLPAAEISTQITPPEGMARFYGELVLLSGILTNLGEDVRILQSSQFGEITSASSTLSTMSHKKANPISAENVAGMHIIIIAEYMKVLMTLVSDLQRDLRWSCVMRSFSAVAVYTYQQILTAEKTLKTIKVNRTMCCENFNKQANVVTAELLHLSLQREGLKDAHRFVNKTIVPLAEEQSFNLIDAMEAYLSNHRNKKISKIWNKIGSDIKHYLLHPNEYTGDAVEISQREAKNIL